MDGWVIVVFEMKELIVVNALYSITLDIVGTVRKYIPKIRRLKPGARGGLHTALYFRLYTTEFFHAYFNIEYYLFNVIP